MSNQPLAPAGRVIGLRRAVADIKGALLDGDAPGLRAVDSPFFLIVGAGISHPQIPLAKDIERLCRQKLAQTSPERMPPDEGSPFERYAACMETAFPHADQRRAFLHGLMQSARLSAANLRLAHLLGAGRITNLVFTPNFDEMLSQALRFLGYPVIVCDHPGMAGRLDQRRDEIQVVHVHGTHWFYDLRNLPQELKEAAEPTHLVPLSLPEFLNHVLHHRSPLVVGYSGWETDILMTSLQKRLKHGLGYNLYWFCHRRNDFDALPGWLKDHEDVRFVMADLEAPAPKTGGEPGERILPARRVFEEMIVALGLQAPETQPEPLGLLENHLKRHLDPEDGEEDAPADPFLISSALARVQRAVEREREEEERQEQGPRRAGALLDEALGAVRRSDYDAALAAARKVDLAALAPNRRMELEEALEQVYLGTNALTSDTGLAACDTRLALAKTALTELPDDLAWRTNQAKAMHGRGYCLGRLGRWEEELSAYEAIIDNHREAQEAPLQERVARALINKGITVGQRGRPEDALAAYEVLLGRFGDSDAPVLQEPIAKALNSKGVALGQLDRPEDALAAYEALLGRFGDSGAPALQEQVAVALYNKGVTLRGLGRLEDELAAYEVLLGRFGDSDAPALQEQVAMALVNKGVAFDKLGRPEDELAAYEVLLGRFGDSDAPALQEQVAMALFNKGFALEKLGRPEDALAAYEVPIGRFGESDAPALQEQVANARHNKGIVLRQLGRG